MYKVKSRPITIDICSTEKCERRELPPPEIYLKQFLEDVAFLESKTNPFFFRKTKHSIWRTKEFAYVMHLYSIRSFLKKIKSHSGYSSCEPRTIEVNTMQSLDMFAWLKGRATHLFILMVILSVYKISIITMLHRSLWI